MLGRNDNNNNNNSDNKRNYTHGDILLSLLINVTTCLITRLCWHGMDRSC